MAQIRTVAGKGTVLAEKIYPDSPAFLTSDPRQVWFVMPVSPSNASCTGYNELVCLLMRMFPP